MSIEHNVVGDGLNTCVRLPIPNATMSVTDVMVIATPARFMVWANRSEWDEVLLSSGVMLFQH